MFLDVLESRCQGTIFAFGFIKNMYFRKSYSTKLFVRFFSQIYLRKYFSKKSENIFFQKQKGKFEIWKKSSIPRKLFFQKIFFRKLQDACFYDNLCVLKKTYFLESKIFIFWKFSFVCVFLKIFFFQIFLKIIFPQINLRKKWYKKFWAVTFSKINIFS